MPMVQPLESQVSWASLNRCTKLEHELCFAEGSTLIPIPENATQGQTGGDMGLIELQPIAHHSDAPPQIAPVLLIRIGYYPLSVL